MNTNPAVTYRELLHLDLRHTYFLSGQLSALAVAPTQATAERLRRAGLLLRQQASGLVLLLPGNLPLTPVAQQALARRVFPLVFALQPRTSAFYLYTDLPARPAESSFSYCFGLPETSVGPAATAISTEASVTGSNISHVTGPQLLALRPLVFDYYLPQELVSGKAVIDNVELWAGSEQLAAWPPKNLDAKLPQALTPSPRTITVNVQQWGSGRYQLRFGATIVDFYSDDDLHAARSWGMLQLDAEALSKSEAWRYVLQLSARRVYWQYHFQFQVPAEDPLSLPILDVRDARSKGQGPAEFEHVTSMSSRENPIFRSKDTIYLNEQYEGRQYGIFAIHSAQRGTEPQWRKILAPLPHADIQQLKNEKEGLVAQIFVSIRM